ncbi:MAG: hypothetical protein R2850_03260 [Bacteroidia bacterium]
MLLWFCLMAVLASDFSDRRLVFLFVLPALAISDLQDANRPDFKRTIAASFFLALPILQYVTPAGLSNSELLTFYLLPGGLLLLLIVAAKFAETKVLKYKGMHSPVLLLASCIMAHSIIYHTSLNWAAHAATGFVPVYCLQLVLLAALLYRCLRQDEYARNLFIYSLVLAQTVVSFLAVSNSAFSIRNKAEQFAELYPTEVRFRGNPQSLELLFLSGALTNFTESAKDSSCKTPALYLWDKNLVDSVKTMDINGCFTSVESDSLVPGPAGFRMSYYFMR